MIHTRLYLGHKSRVIIVQLLKLGAAIALLAACSTAAATPEPANADRSFTTGQPCAAPCWYGLELNKATEKDVLAKLNELPFVDHTAIRTSSSPMSVLYRIETRIDYGCAEPRGQYCGSLVWYDDKLKQIDIAVQYSLTLQTVVNMLGKPVYYRNGAATPHGQGCFVEVDWPDKGMSVTSTDYDSNTVCQALSSGKGFDPMTPVTEIDYLADALLRRVGECGCIDWPGFQGP